MIPKTLDDWIAYIGTLSGEDLMAKARAANQVAFVRMLEDDDLPPIDIAGVFTAFARRLAEDGQEPPARSDGSYVDFATLLVPPDLAADVSDQ